MHYQPRARIFGSCGVSHLKVLTLALVCMATGFMITSMLASFEDVSRLNELNSKARTTWDRKPKEAEAITIVPSEEEDDDVWSHSNQEVNRTDMNDDTHEIRPSDESKMKYTISNWQNHLANKLSSWYSSSWGRPSTNSDSTSPINYTLGDSIDAPPGSSLYKSAPRIAKCTISFNHNPVYERALRTHDAHNQMHNYPLYISRQTILDDVWTKPAWVLALMLRELARPPVERLEWLFWMDADTVLLNPYIPISAFLPPENGDFDNVNLVVQHDSQGLNNGVFAIRVCRWSVQLLTAILAFPHYKPDFTLSLRDQSAMEELLKEKRFRRYTVQAPQRWFNAYQGEHNETLAPHQVRRGDFLVHFAGTPEREKRMRYWLDRAEQHLPDWEIEYQHTSYPTEVREFWAEVAAEKEARAKRLENAKAKVKDFEELVQKRLEEFEDKLSETEKEKLSEERDLMKDVMAKDETKEDPDRVEEVLQKLQEVSH